MSDIAFSVLSRCGAACTGGCGRAGQVVCGGRGFAGLKRILEEEAALGNHSKQNPASVWVTNSWHDMGHCQVKCSLCSVQQVWWSLQQWRLLQG